MVKVAINGFGRIGRLSFRIGLTKHANELEFVAINTSGSLDTDGWAYLTNYDSMYRKFEKEVKSLPAQAGEKPKDGKDATDSDPLIGNFKVDGKTIPILAQRDPEKLPWSKYDVDVVIESTGKF